MCKIILSIINIQEIITKIIDKKNFFSMTECQRPFVQYSGLNKVFYNNNNNYTGIIIYYGNNIPIYNLKVFCIIIGIIIEIKQLIILKSLKI